MSELSKTLKNQAVSLGLCAEWTEAWGNPDKQGLIDKYLHGIDFCIKHDYPSVEFIKKHFEPDLLHRNNIFVNEEVSRRNMNLIAVLNGKCTGTLLFDGFSSCDVYIRHESNITIDCSRLSKVFINIYDYAKINVIARDAASVYVYQHGNNCSVNSKGEVMVRISES